MQRVLYWMPNRYARAKENLGKQTTQVLGYSATNLSKFGSTVTDGLPVSEKRYS